MMKKTFKPGERFNAHKMKHKNWIAGAIKKPGALRKELGVKAGKKIPAKTLTKAAKKGGKEGKRARLAETLKGFKHKKKHKFSFQGLKNGAKKIGGEVMGDLKLMGKAAKQTGKAIIGSDIKDYLKHKK